MSVAIVTGSGGLVGSESVEQLVKAGFHVVGIENDMRATFFGRDATTKPVSDRLAQRFPAFEAAHFDIRDSDAVNALFARHSSRIELIVHAAAQPSHDWAATAPLTDFSINALGTMTLLEATRRHAPDATFVFSSTNKVYGDTPNRLPLEELETRFELPKHARYHVGIDTSMSIDRSMHSLFGVSKSAADLMVQEYGRYFNIPTVCFRAGCITGPNHAGARLHGFLSYLVRCAATQQNYTIYGHGGKQVRDNIHVADIVSAFLAFHRAPRVAAVYNLGGGRESNCSVIEAIEICERVVGRTMKWSLDASPRKGDHRWWISDVGAFRSDYSEWTLTHALNDIVREIYELNHDRWTAS